MDTRQNNAPTLYILEDERQKFEKKLQDSTTDDDTRARIAHILKEARILNPENGTVGLKPGIVNIGKTIRYKVQSLLSENTFEWTFRIGGNESPIPWRIPHDTPFAAKFKGRKVDEDNSIFTVLSTQVYLVIFWLLMMQHIFVGFLLQMTKILHCKSYRTNIDHPNLFKSHPNSRR